MFAGEGFHSLEWRRIRATFVPLALLVSGAQSALGTDITGVLPGALDQPQVNFIVRPTDTQDPWIYDDVFSGQGFNVTGFLDTGASGVLINGDSAAALYRPGDPSATDLPRQTLGGRPVYFEDIGVAGGDRFTVSQGVHLSLAPYHPDIDQKISDKQDQFNSQGSFSGVDLSFYNQKYDGVRAQVSAPNPDPNNPGPLDGVNVIGMPVMKNKVVVMDARPLNALQFDTLRTYLYDPGTAYKPATDTTDPGIPRTTRTIKLSYGDFDSFTHTGTLDDQGNFVPLTGTTLAQNQPTLAHNPFIGPNPLAPAGDTTPPIKLSYQTDPNDASTLHTASGSFLLDTGAAASMISSNLASKLSVRYTPGTQGTDDPKLETYDPAHPSSAGTPITNQFQLAVGGVGGTTTVAGFYLDSMLVHTTEGNAANDNDPKHFRFVGAPVLVNDINISATQTLDGIFGMNMLFGSLDLENIDLGDGTKAPFPIALSPGAFDFAVFDEPNGLLKLRPRIPGDANHDGTVDFNDLVKLAQHYNGATDPNDYWAGGDFNGDNVVDFQDLVALAQHYNLSDITDGDRIDLPYVPFDLGGAAAASAPEPAALTVLGLGFVLVSGRRVRRRRA
jgi:hypothetical protein